MRKRLLCHRHLSTNGFPVRIFEFSSNSKSRKKWWGKCCCVLRKRARSAYRPAKWQFLRRFWDNTHGSIFKIYINVDAF